MSVEGVKHLIQCHCVLPQYRNANPPMFHKFVTFSVVDDDQFKAIIDSWRSDHIWKKDNHNDWKLRNPIWQK